MGKRTRYENKNSPILRRHLRLWAAALPRDQTKLLSAWGISGTDGLTAGHFKLNPLWAELRDDPRFEKIEGFESPPIR
jgi:hypothetical protein